MTCDKQAKDFVWFVEHYDELSARYAPCFLVINNQEVAFAVKTVAEALEKALLVFDYGEFIIQECTGAESAYTGYIASAFI